MDLKLEICFLRLLFMKAFKILLCLIIVCGFSCEHQDLPGDLVYHVLVDDGFRIPLVSEDVEEMFVIGDNVLEINLEIRRTDYEMEEDYFKSLNEYIENKRLRHYQSLFPRKDHDRILDENLCKRNSEEILSDNFFIGCGDICVVNAAVLKSNGYNVSLIILVSEYFSDRNDWGHVLLYIEKENKTYLFDPALSREVYSDYTLNTEKFQIFSSMGDLYVFAISDNPRKHGIVDKQSLTYFRELAHNNWKNKKDN